MTREYTAHLRFMALLMAFVMFTESFCYGAIYHGDTENVPRERAKELKAAEELTVGAEANSLIAEMNSLIEELKAVENLTAEEEEDVNSLIAEIERLQALGDQIELLIKQLQSSGVLRSGSTTGRTTALSVFNSDISTTTEYHSVIKAITMGVGAAVIKGAEQAKLLAAARSTVIIQTTKPEYFAALKVSIVLWANTMNIVDSIKIY
ncbi:hypothetical protein Barb6_03159 [Bacteroidales bacterium Barb6]|nr:hypothetical protein Barb6_03159 [Bacteroidales bacterium Barb6]